MDIGQRIKEERKKRALSQSQLGNLAGVGYQTILLIEQGKGCNIKTLQAICEALGLELIIN